MYDVMKLTMSFIVFAGIFIVTYASFIISLKFKNFTEIKTESPLKRKAKLSGL